MLKFTAFIAVDCAIEFAGLKEDLTFSFEVPHVLHCAFTDVRPRITSEIFLISSRTLCCDFFEREIFVFNDTLLLFCWNVCSYFF